MSMHAINITSIITALITFLGYVVFMILRARRKVNEARSKWSQRVEKLSSPSSSLETRVDELKVTTLIKSKTPTDSYFTSKLQKVEGFNEWILHSGLEINPIIFSSVSFLIGIIIAGIIFIIFHVSLFLSSLLGLLSAFVFPWVFITILTSRRKNEFLASFPIALDMIRRALKSGHSVDRALEMVVDHVHGPVGEAFKKVTEKMRLGETPENALADVANRVGVDDFRMLAIVIVLQRETGGSLAEATDNFAKIIRSRQGLRKKIQALTAEGRVSAVVLICIPLFVMGSILITTPRYLDPLFLTEKGQNLLIIAALMMIAGVTTILRMVYKEIY